MAIKYRIEIHINAPFSKRKMKQLEGEVLEVVNKHLGEPTQESSIMITGDKVRGGINVTWHDFRRNQKTSQPVAGK